MTVLLTLFVGISLLFLGKYLFNKWFNHFNIYIFSWALYISLYELKLIRYIELTNEVWFVMIFSTLSYILGVLTIFAARYSQNKSNRILVEPVNISFDLFKDNGRTLMIVILITSFLGLLSAYLHWAMLIKKFGSIPAVLIQANIIYKLRVEGEITEAVPYLYIISYVGIFFSGIYTAYKNRISFVALLPLIAIIFKDMASVGRAGIFVGFLEFMLSLLLFRHIITQNKQKSVRSKRNIIIAMVVFAAVAIASMSLVRTMRGNIESFKASSQSLNKLKGGSVITPSIYLYFSSNVGVLSQYFSSGGEKGLFGENTFLPIYNFLAKFEIVDQPDAYPKGYYVPMWTNSATYLRELHVDFGNTGLFLVPYLLGLFTTFYWFRFYEKHRLKDFVFLVYLNLVISFSAIYLIARSSAWLLSFIFLLIIIPPIENIIRKKTRIETISL